MKNGDLLVHRTVKYSAIVRKVFKNGNAILELIPTKITKEQFGKVEKGDCIKAKDVLKWFDVQACSSCEYMNEIGMCWSRKEFAEYGKIGCDYRMKVNSL